MTTVLLGPQRDGATLAVETERLRGEGAVAVVTAGWQEWEDQGREVLSGLGSGVVNLELYRRAERIWARDPDLAEGHRELQRRLRMLRRSYNMRLERAMDAWIAMERLTLDPVVIGGERESACDGVRLLDGHHRARMSALRADFEEHWRPAERGAVAEERLEVARLLDGVGVVLMAGGHLPVLLNRLRLFDLDVHLRDRSVIAWAGGAMATADRVVLFHDSPPWGPGHAEVGEVGLARVPGVVVLSDAGRRLRLDDPDRVGRMARRFAPERCLVLDPGARMEWEGAAVVAASGQRLGAAGDVAPWGDAA